MKILFAGIIARYPFGGVTWCSLMYLLGSARSATRSSTSRTPASASTTPCRTRARRTRPTGRPTSTRPLEPFGLGDRWSFVNYDGSYHGRSAPRTCDGSPRPPTCSSTCRADRGSGATSTRASRDRHSSIPIRRSHNSRSPRLSPGTSSSSRGSIGCSRLGANIGTAASPVPVGDFVWRPTWQPIVLDEWRTDRGPGDRFTTVMTWQIESFTDVGGNKDVEFVKYIDLPSRTAQPFELAVNGPRSLLAAHGWTTVDAMGVSRTPWDYRDFIHRSKAEFGVAKHTYVATARAGSAIAPSAISRRAVPRSCRTRAGRRTCRRAKACSPSRRPTRRWPASIASTRATPARTAPTRDGREHFDASRVTAGCWRRPAHDEPRPATQPGRCGSRTSRRSRRPSRRRSPDRSRR